MSEKIETQNQSVKFTRRDFLRTSAAAVGKGLLLAFYLPSAVRGISSIAEIDSAVNESATSFSPNAFLRVNSDDTITIWVGKVEMGQGVRTSLPMLVAEELEADWSKVRVEQGILDGAESKYGNLDTGGSGSIREGWEPLRRAGATAREMLIAAAAAKWNIAPAACRAEKNRVIHLTTKKSLSYGQLAEAAAKLPIPKEIALKNKRDFKIIGKSAARVDGRDIVTGKAGYGIDVRVPGMLFASVVRCPVWGGKLAEFDDAKAKQIACVRHVVELKTRNEPTAVAVVADSNWAAIKGREALTVKWDEGANTALNSKDISRMFAAKSKEAGTITLNFGDVDKAFSEAASRIEAEYELPFMAHAPVETINCAAHFHDGVCEIWSPTQFPAWARRACAQALGIKPEMVKVHPTLLGGGFGRRINPDYAAEAAQLSKVVNAPVQIVWSREDDMRHGFYRPASLHHLSATLDDEKSLSAWRHKITGTSIMASVSGGRFPKPEAQEMWGAMDLPYRTPNLQIAYVHAQTPVPLGWWRAVERTQNVFVTESFIDEVAFGAMRDPLEFRVALLKNQGNLKFKDFFPPDKPDEQTLEVPRLLRVLQLAAQKAGWGKKLPALWGRGIACHGYSHVKTYVAQVAEVEIMPGGVPRVRRIVCAIDCGTAVNPDGIAAQIEGSVAWGISSVFGGSITIENGRVVEGTYRDYPVARMADMPLVEVHIIPSDLPPGGVGEPGVPPVAPAITNAIFAATGKRIRRLPLRLEDFE